MKRSRCASMRSRKLAVLPIVALCALLIPPPAGASFPGDNGKIAFASDCAIYLVNPDGSGVQQVTHPRGCGDGVIGLEVSADGGKIAFARWFDQPDPGQSDLFVVDLDTGAETQLTDTPQVAESTPTWSPDGRQIAFVRHAPGLTLPDGNLFAIGVRDRSERQLTRSNLDGAPDWSPDGQRIVFSRAESPLGALMTIDLTGRELRLPIHNKARDPRHPDWSPDGRRIVYEASMEPGSSGIFLANASPSNPQGGILATGRDVGHLGDRPHTPVWSPSGTSIAFARGPIRRTIQVMNADGSGERLVLAPPTGFGTVWDLDWQPVRSLIDSTCQKAKEATKPIGGPIDLKLPIRPPAPSVPAICDSVDELTRPVNTLITDLPFGRFLTGVIVNPFEATGDPVGTVDEAVEHAEQTVGGVQFPALIAGAQMKYRTVFRRDDGSQVVKEHSAAVGESKGLDADGDVLRQADVYAQLLPVDPLALDKGLRMCVAPTPVVCGAPAVPVTQTPRIQVEAVIDDPATSRLAFGFDARQSGIPRLFDATLTDTSDAEDDERFLGHLQTTKVRASDKLALLVDLHTYGDGANGVRENCDEPTDEGCARTTTGRVEFDPVPLQTQVAADLGDPLRVEMRATESSFLTAHMDDSGDLIPTRTVDAQLPVPAATRPGALLELASFGAAYRTADEKLELYSGAPIAQASFDYEEVGADGTQELHASATELPATIDLDLGEPSPGVLRADYDASGDLGSLTLDVIDTRGLAGRAQELHAFASDIPPHIDVILGDATGQAGGDLIDALGGTIGLVEAQLIDRWSEESAYRLPSGTDGVLFRDKTDAYALFARATDLRRLRLVKAGSLSTGGPCGEGFSFCAEVNKGASRPLLVDLEMQANYLRTTLDSLQAGATEVKFGKVKIGEEEEGDYVAKIHYRAPAEARELTLDTNAEGSVASLHVDLHPVPPSMNICQATTLDCGPAWSPHESLKSPIVSVNFDARDTAGKHRPTTLNLNLREAGSLGEYTKINDLTLSKLILQASSDVNDHGCGDTPLFFYADTDDLPISGSGEIVDFCGEATPITFRLPVGDPGTGDTVRAQDRMLVMNWAGGTADEDGSMHCPSGTEILLKDQDLLSNDVDVQDELCSEGDALD